MLQKLPQPHLQYLRWCLNRCWSNICWSNMCGKGTAFCRTPGDMDGIPHGTSGPFLSRYVATYHHVWLVSFDVMIFLANHACPI